MANRHRPEIEGKFKPNGNWEGQEERKYGTDKT